MNPVRVVLFCGGRGSATIIRALLRRTDIALTLLVNGYDDGLSTGALRSFIPGMLGPSDFRKNFSYLLGNYSSAQYALKSLMEYRLSPAASEAEIRALKRFLRTGELQALPEPLQAWFAQMPTPLSLRLRELLARFFTHAEGAPFDYRDCSLGNLVFAGAYLAKGRDFNAAAAEVAELVASRATLLNVSDQQNRILVGVKQDGTVLASEAAIVGIQAPSPIADLYLLEHPLSSDDIAHLSTLGLPEKRAWLAARAAPPALSRQAGEALAAADIILYGPGTQHSSLLPSYLIAAKALAASPAPVKALVMNLDSDHDIQGLAASDLVDLALSYGAPVSDILFDPHSRLAPGGLRGESYRGAHVQRGDFAMPFHPHLHNGNAVVEKILALHAGSEAAHSVDIFVDIHNRSVAGMELVEEFVETDWGATPAHLTLNRVAYTQVTAPVATVHLSGLFPEGRYLRDWLRSDGADYLVLMTGDGAYSFRDVRNIIALLEQRPSLGGVFGSRTQSRRQFIQSVQAAYGEHRLLYRLGKMAAFLLSVLFYLRTGVIFSDPLTGLRVFRRKALAQLPGDVAADDAPLAVARQLIRHGVEVAELPVLYRTFSGFTDPDWRMRRGLHNLLSLLK